MLISEFDYELPVELIAQEPLAARGSSRMLVVNRTSQNWHNDNFQNFPQLIKEGDCLVLNNTRVFPARLVGSRKGFEGRIELFLIRAVENQIWETLARPAKKLKEGTNLIFGDDKLRAQVLDKTADGRILVEFEAGDDFYDVLEEVGQIPLPPYIRRNEKPTEKDRERYQTVFAKSRGAIAAPTAGLHFTPAILQSVKEKGVKIVEITLHVGYGTFEPVRVEDLSQHMVAPEFCEISTEAANIINETKSAQYRVFAVGTTTTRALEAATNGAGKIESGARLANLTITPGYNFKTVNALLTNFHLPQSSLLVLVSTFAGHELTMKAYAHAVAEKYRFYSYGDCMLII